MGFLLLEDTAVQPHCPVARMLDRDDMRELFPQTPPRKVVFIFKHNKPLDMEMECQRKGFHETDTMRISQRLQEKFDSVQVSEHSPVQEDELNEMSVQELRSHAKLYGIRWGDLLVTTEEVLYMIRKCQQHGIVPMTEDEYKELKQTKTTAEITKPFTEVIR